MINNFDNEIWKDVVGFEGLYQVSNLGRIKVVRKDRYFNHIKSQRLDKYGYKVVRLSKDGKENYFLVHRLVGKVFIPNDDPINKFQINHRNEIKTDNRAENLEWCTNEYNFNYNNNSCSKRSIEEREKKRIDGILRTKKSRKVLQINPITNEIINEYLSLTDVKNKTGYSSGTVYTACNDNRIHYGCIWVWGE